MSDYTPGTVAIVTNDDEQLLAFRVSWPAEDWMSVDDGSLHAVSDVRPLVVLDPDDREQMERFAQAIFAQRAYTGDALAAALRSLTRPPKPAEPQGLGAVVEDTAGLRWTKVGERTNCWVPDGLGLDGRLYAEIDVADVLSEGVQP